MRKHAIVWSVLRVAAFVAAFVVGVFAQMVFRAMRKVKRLPTPLETLTNALLSYLERNLKTKEQVVDLFEKFSGTDTAAGKT